jgi:hypothetical protein
MLIQARKLINTIHFFKVVENILFSPVSLILFHSFDLIYISIKKVNLILTSASCVIVLIYEWMIAWWL